ncbi:MAG TPA: hypothetical protein VET30_02825 [Pseudoxanthomonas sp.]|nr:hypothetical protein [Pseudoxanthomonas sp.]
MAKRREPEFWRRHLEAWHQSDLTQDAYCASHGLSTKTFYRWRRKEKESVAAAKSSLTLVPVSLGTPTPGSVVRLHSPGGWKIELADGSIPWLPDLLRQLP